MTKKRLFIAINLPEKIKDGIEEVFKKIRREFTQDVRFLDRENWHITISFLGYQNDEFINPILKSMEDVAKKFKQPEMRLTDINYGPKDKMPRMIWLNADPETSKELALIKEELENNLINRGVGFKKEHRQMNVHITLARFKPTRKVPEIKTDFKHKFFAPSLDLMESHLSKSGAKYDVLQAIKFNI